MNENKVIDLTARLPRRFERVPSDESWTELCKTAVIPALDICGRRLCNEGVKTEIQLIEPRRAPHQPIRPVDLGR